MEGHVNTFETLLEKGASIDDSDKDGKTAVHLAAEEDQMDFLEVSHFHG